VKTKTVFRGLEVSIIGRRPVSARDYSQEGRQGARRYFSAVETRCVGRGRVVHRHVLYLGEINDSQELAWLKSIEAFEEEGTAPPRPPSPFADDRCEGIADDASVVRLKLKQLRLLRPRTFGACWLTLRLWRELQLDRFWNEKLPPSRKGMAWDQVLFVLVAYRVLGSDESLSEIGTLHRCQDRLLVRKQPCSSIWSAAGAICSTPASRCCFTIRQAPITDRMLGPTDSQYFHLLISLNIQAIVPMHRASCIVLLLLSNIFILQNRFHIVKFVLAWFTCAKPIATSFHPMTCA
jgi:hypothetical protein